MIKGIRSAEMAYSLALLLTVILVGWISYGCYRFVETTLLSIPYQVFTALGITCCASLAAVAVGAAVFVVRWMNYRSCQIFAKNGLYPHVYDGRGYINLNEAGAQRIAALSSCKPSAAVISKAAESWQQIGKGDPALIPGPAAEAAGPLTVADFMNFDLKLSPHCGLFGNSGSGKTCACFKILAEMQRLYAAEFIICEFGGVNWGRQARATEADQIANVIIEMQQEMERRQALLRQHDIAHVSDLPEPARPLILVVEEFDSTFQNLRVFDKSLHHRAVVALRAIAAMGRKAGVCLVVVSTGSTLDVLDSHVRKNIDKSLLFRCEHSVSESWRTGKKLNRLPVGMAYSVAHEDFVQFPPQNRPQLVPEIPQEGHCGSYALAQVVPVSCGSAPVPPRLQGGSEPDAATAQQVRDLFAAGYSKNELCRKFFGSKGGKAWERLNEILQGADGAGALQKAA